MEDVSSSLLPPQRLHQISRLNAGTQLQAKKPMNLTRNRYRDVLPSECGKWIRGRGRRGGEGRRGGWGGGWKREEEGERGGDREREERR